MAKIKRFFSNNLHILIVLAVAALCATFIIVGTKSENGYITLSGEDATITNTTKEWMENAEKALARVTDNSIPTDEATIEENSVDEVGLGFSTSIDAILGRRLPDGDTDGGKGWQCSKYTAYLATGKREYSTVHPDYGPANGKDIADYLARYYGFKYIDTPVAGAIGSGGFNTKYGHTVMFLYYTGTNTAMVNDANYTPLTVSTHVMNIAGWKWVVPGDYTPTPEPIPTPTPTPAPTPISDCKTWYVKKGDTMGKIMKYCTGRTVWGAEMAKYANRWVSTVVKPGQTVYQGWISTGRVGLYAGDIIKYQN